MSTLFAIFFFFFFQAEDGIRDRNVTGVQTCALPISTAHSPPRPATSPGASPTSPALRSFGWHSLGQCAASFVMRNGGRSAARSEERRVGKECRCRGAAGE